MKVIFVLISFSSIWFSNAYVYRSYQTTVYCNASRPIQFPSTVPHLVTLVGRAIQEGQKVKAIGSRHSVTDIICTQGIPISLERISYARLSTDGQTATIGAGMKLEAALEFLEARNRSFAIIPSYGGVSVGGALSTGSHGSSLRHPTTLSELVVSMRLIIGNGSLVEITGSDLDFFRVQLGLLGVIVDVTVETVPLFKMTVENRLTDDSSLFDGSLLDEAGHHDLFQLWWFPESRHTVVELGRFRSRHQKGTAYANFIPNVSQANERGIDRILELGQVGRLGTPILHLVSTLIKLSLLKRVPGKPPIFTEDGKSLKNPATGFGWRLMSNRCGDKGDLRCPWGFGQGSVSLEESGMAFDLRQFTEVIRMIQRVLKQYPAIFGFVGVYIRFSTVSPAKMGISYGRPTFTVEWTTHTRFDPFEHPRHGGASFQAILQEMVYNYGGRPHWAKNGLYYTSSKVLERAVPNRRTFVEVMNRYDPNGLFLNAFGRRLRDLTDVQERDPRVTHCALQDYCVCSKSQDCATFQYCGRINGFPVCLDDQKKRKLKWTSFTYKRFC